MKEKMMKIEKSDICKFRKKFLKKGIELIDITPHCKFKLGNSGWCNNFNDPDDAIYHIQVLYRDEQIAVFGFDGCYVIDDDKFVIFKSDDILNTDFIIFYKAKFTR